jgi:hypothetical protein
MIVFLLCTTFQATLLCVEQNSVSKLACDQKMTMFMKV